MMDAFLIWLEGETEKAQKIATTFANNSEGRVWHYARHTAFKESLEELKKRLQIETHRNHD